MDLNKPFVLRAQGGIIAFMVPIVSGRSKPATSGRLKTSHFEEVRIRLVAWTTAPALWEANNGEPAQN
ncbi:MAG TPA: hypothetical protein VGP68_05845, partial [Gemmataceae bacterium]|nr:hypothetical protein [Gemmataceae bacterium]